MEGSRRGKGSREKGLPTPDPHVDGGNGKKKKTIVYNTKKEKKRPEKRKRKKKGKKVEEIQQQKGEFSTLSHSTRACPRILSAYVCV